MAKAKETRQKKKKGRSVQELLGIKTFTKYGLAVGKHELLFYLVSPTNISVLSRTNIEIKIRLTVNDCRRIKVYNLKKATIENSISRLLQSERNSPVRIVLYTFELPLRSCRRRNR